MQRSARRPARDLSAPGSRMKAELELRAEMKKVEAEIAQVISLVRSIDEVLNQTLPLGPEAVPQYLSWLDRVEALGLQYVNANIVTHGLRLFYQSPRRSRRRTPEPTPRMKEVKDLLDTVRHNEQSNLLLLRAKRHSLENDIQHLAGERKSDGTAGHWGNGLRGRSTRNGGGRSLGWVQVLVLVAALLAGSLLLDAVRPEVVQFLRTRLGLDGTAAAPGETPGASSSQQDRTAPGAGAGASGSGASGAATPTTGTAASTRR